MSHFIAHTITISKDFKTFKVKGGDNNVVPRMNYWSSDIPIEDLYYELNGGMIKLNNSIEKNYFINHLVNSMDFGGNWDNETDYFHVKNNDKENSKLKEFDERFLNALKDGLKSLRTNPKYIIQLNYSYIRKATRGYVYTSRDKKDAKEFPKYMALKIKERFGYKNHCELIEVESY